MNKDLKKQTNPQISDRKHLHLHGAPDPAGAQVPAIENPRLLIVDDNEQNLYMLQVLLEGYGYQVVSARDGAEALELARRDPPDMIIADILMPIMDGFSLCRRWKADEQLKTIPLVFYTATYTDSKDEEFALSLGAERFIVKPTEPVALVKILQEVIEEHQAGRLVAPREPVEEEKIYLREYNEVLVRKLEDKMVELEEANRVLERELAERKQAAEEILRLQHLLQNVADSMPSALIALDTDGQVLLWNPAAEALTGRSLAQAQGQPLWQACPELVRYRDLFEQVLREGRVMHLLKEQLATEARAVYRNVSVFPLTAGAVLRIDDVTRQVQLEEMMLQSAKMASIGRLAAGIAHELNNPLGAMMQGAQVLQMALNTQRPHTHQRLQAYDVDPGRLDRYLQERGLLDYLEGIREAGERAGQIISDLLSFSRKSSSDMVPHNLNSLVEQALKLAATDYDLRKKYDFRDIEIVREFTPDLPPVACDGQQIQQVVLNLVRNAAQAMAGEIDREDGDRDGEYKPRLMLRTFLRQAQDEAIGNRKSETVNRKSKIVNPKSKIVNRMVRLEVEDNGPGIPEAVRARLFEPFFTTKDVGEGSGLGLWLCWSIVVERHGGRMWVEPAPERGTRFVVELPKKEANYDTH